MLDERSSDDVEFPMKVYKMAVSLGEVAIFKEAEQHLLKLRLNPIFFGGRGSFKPPRFLSLASFN